MPLQSFRSIVITLLLLALTSCTDDPRTPRAVELTATPAGPDYYTGITLREIMSSLIDPHADALWNAVRVVSDSNGITEYYPETEDEWAALRISAVTMVEGANALMMPGRKVAPPGATGEFPEFEFTPQEVEGILAEDRLAWDSFAKELQNQALDMLSAVDARDPEKLTETGAYLDEACESCHAVYWYRSGI